MATGQNPQLTPQELQQLIDLYKRVDGLTQSAAQNMANLANQQGNARAELDRLNDVWNDFVRNISYAEQQFIKIADQIKNQASGINRAAASYDKLRSISAKVSDIQNGIRSTSEKELKSLKEKLNSEKKRLETLERILNSELQAAQTRGDISAIYKLQNALNQIQKTIADNESYFKAIGDAIEIEEKHLRKVNETLGLTGVVMKGMSKIPFLGDLPGMKEAMEELNSEISEAIRDGKTITKAEALGMAFKKVGGVVKDALTDPLLGLSFIFKQVINAFKLIDNQAGDLAKNMNITYGEAVQVRQELGNIALSSMGDINISVRALGESLMAVNSALGVTATLTEEDLKTFTKLREQAGFTNEELISINKISMGTNKSVKDTAAGFLGAAKALSIEKGLAINVKQLMKETANVSNAIKLSIGGTPEALGKAAAMAKSFGMNLEQADKIAGSLLNFEDSISAELEAELLTGKQLNLETARYAALTGDLSTLTEEISKQIGSSKDFTKMNRIQQEAVAKAVGMTREELANTLVEQEAINNLGRELTDQEKEAYEFAKQKYGADKANKMLGEGQLDIMMQQQSVQERLNKAIEHLQEIFASIMDGPLGSILSAFATILGNAHLMKGLITAIGIASIPWAISMAATAVSAIASMSALTLGIGAVAIAAGIAVAAASASNETRKAKSVVKANDMVSSPGYGKRTLHGPEGSIALNDKDTIVAGTSLFNKGGSSNSSLDTSGIISALNEIKNVLNNILSKEGKVEINGQEAGVVLAPIINSINIKTSVKSQ